MLSSVRAKSGAGDIRAFTTDGRGATPEEWTWISMRRIVTVSPEQPEPSRRAAEVLRNRLAGVLLEGLRNAVASDRRITARLIARQGFGVIARRLLDAFPAHSEAEALPVSEWASRLLAAFLHIADDQPPAVRRYFYENDIRLAELLRCAAANAIKSDRTNIILFLNRQGENELADFIRSL